jgi:hypothetical protein
VNKGGYLRRQLLDQMIGSAYPCGVTMNVQSGGDGQQHLFVKHEEPWLTWHRSTCYLALNAVISSPRRKLRRHVAAGWAYWSMSQMEAGTRRLSTGQSQSIDGKDQETNLASKVTFVFISLESGHPSLAFIAID